MAEFTLDSTMLQKTLLKWTRGLQPMAIDSAGAGLPDLPVYLDSPVETGDDRGLHLDACGDCLLGLQDTVLPERLSELRRAPG